MDVKPVILEGKHVRLEPMTEAHVPDLAEIGAGQTFWDFMLYGNINTVDDMHHWVLDILSRAEKGTDLPFVAIHLASGRVAGATRYLNIMPNDRGLEIGGTWYGPEFQRTPLNTECKYLLLLHAFETLGCPAVEFRTHWLNHQSREAITRLGAKQDGVLRSHTRSADGALRDTVVYSILEHEWPMVRNALESRLAKRR